MVAWSVQWNLLKHQLLLLISHGKSLQTVATHARWHSHWTFSLNVSMDDDMIQNREKLPIAPAVCICVGSDYVWGAWRHFFCLFQLFKVHGEMLILETAPGQACVALTLLPFWFWQCDSCNRNLGLKEQVQKCACVWTWIQIKAWTLMFHCLCRFYSYEFTDRWKEQKGWRTERW